MASGVLTSFKLDPFFQTFLKSHFQCGSDAVFTFPKGHDLLRRLEVLLRPVPENYKPSRSHPALFHVELPYMKHKDPLYYNYLSDTAGKAFARKVRDFYELVFHERMSELRNAGYEYKECVYLFQDEYDLPPESTDRLIKDFQRWRNRIRRKNIRKRKREEMMQMA